MTATAPRQPNGCSPSEAVGRSASANNNCWPHYDIRERQKATHSGPPTVYSKQQPGPILGALCVESGFQQTASLVQSRLGRLYLLKELATSTFARKNGLVHFCFSDDRELLNIANQRLEVIGLRGLARVVKQINGSCQYGPHFRKHAKCFMSAL